MANSMKIKKGDTAVVISGKEKGKKAKVLRVLPGDGKVVMEAVNMVTKKLIKAVVAMQRDIPREHSAPTQRNSIVKSHTSPLTTPEEKGKRRRQKNTCL